MGLIDDIKIGEAIEINLGEPIAVETEPEPLVIEGEGRISTYRGDSLNANDLVEPEHTITLTSEQVRFLWQLSVNEGKRWVALNMGIEDELAAMMVHSVAVGIDRAFKDLNLILDYEITFRL